MKTTHQIIFENSKNMRSIASNSVDLIVTSPPYPMIKMWDEMFAEPDPEIREVLSLNQGSKAFELMHRGLEPVWDEVYRILKKGGIACVNIGDATRTIGGNFELYPNHSRILTYLHKLGFLVYQQFYGENRPTPLINSWDQECYPLGHTSPWNMSLFLY